MHKKKEMKRNEMKYYITGGALSKGRAEILKKKGLRACSSNFWINEMNGVTESTIEVDMMFIKFRDAIEMAVCSL